MLGTVIAIERRDLAHSRIDRTQRLQWRERPVVGRAELNQPRDASLVVGEGSARNQSAHAVSDDERLAFAAAFDQAGERAPQLIDIAPPVERTEQRPKAGNLQAQTQLQITRQHHADRPHSTRPWHRELHHRAIRDCSRMQPEQRIAAPRDEAEARAHDPGQHEHAAATRITTRRCQLRELRQLAILRLAEIGAQQRSVCARAQQGDDLVVMQIAEAGNAGFGHLVLRKTSTSGWRRTRP